MPSELAIETRRLRKRFHGTEAVRGIDLRVRRGTVYGLLGPNGAGKTTTVRMLSTLLPPSGGEARVLGHDLVNDAERIRARIAPAGPLSPAEEELSGRDHLMVLARMTGLSWLGSRVRSDALLKTFELSDAARRPIKELPPATRQRLNNAASLLTGSELIFLDDPTRDLALTSRQGIWDMVREASADGATVLLATPSAEEAEQLAQRIAIMEQGAIVAEGSSQELAPSMRRLPPHQSAPYWLTDTSGSATLPGPLN